MVLISAMYAASAGRYALAPSGMKTGFTNEPLNLPIVSVILDADCIIHLVVILTQSKSFQLYCPVLLYRIRLPGSKRALVWKLYLGEHRPLKENHLRYPIQDLHITTDVISILASIPTPMRNSMMVS